MEVLFQDRDWLVINKPTGISSQAAFPADIDVVKWLKSKHNETVHVFSRLDKGTSGVMILARNPAAAKLGQDLHAAGETAKRYIFLSPSDSEKKRHGSIWTISTAIEDRPAKTHFKKIGMSGTNCLYSATITRGRLHQIRRHARESGVPILGDHEYGGVAFPRVCLHCKSIKWPKIDAELVAPTPPSMGHLGDFVNDPGFLVAFDRRVGVFEASLGWFRCVNRGEIHAVDCVVDFFGGTLCVWILDDLMTFSEIELKLQPYLKKLSSWYGTKSIYLQQLAYPEKTKIIGSPPPESVEVTPNDTKLALFDIQRIASEIVPVYF